MSASFASQPPFGYGMGAIVHSRGAFALVILGHVICALLLIKLLDVSRIQITPPLIVEILELEPEMKDEPPPKKKPPEPKVEEPPPEEIPPEEPPPEEPVIEPDVPPEPLPQAELPLPRPIQPEPLPELIRPVPAPEPAPVQIVRRPVEPVNQPPPLAPPRNPVRDIPSPPILAVREPTPTLAVIEPPRIERSVQAPEAPRVAPPKNPVRDSPSPPILAVREPMPVAAVVKVSRIEKPLQAPEAPRVAPREPPRHPIPEAMPVMEIAEAPMPPGSDADVPEPPVVALPQPTGPAPEGPEMGINAQMLTALYLRNPKPGYPAASRRLGEQGTVLLRVFVTVAGEAKRVELKSTSGHVRLDRAAQESVQRWRFVPATRDDKPVDAWVLVPIKFSLNK